MVVDADYGGTKTYPWDEDTDDGIADGWKYHNNDGVQDIDEYPQGTVSSGSAMGSDIGIVNYHSIEWQNIDIDGSLPTL